MNFADIDRFVKFKKTLAGVLNTVQRFLDHLQIKL